MSDPQFFAMKLDNIIIGSQKLFANLPRFQRGEWKNKEIPVQRNVHKVNKAASESMGFRTLGVSYAQAFKEGGQGRHKERNAPKQEMGHLTFSVEESVIQKMNKAYVGQVSESGMSYAIQEEFNKQGFFDVKATPLGANLVLLEAEDDEAIPNLINNAKDWIGDWFEEIRSWCPSEIDNERLVWLKCYGIPAHAWNKEFFSFLFSGIGSFICADESTEKKECMDVARILYKTKVHDLVSRLVKVNINGDIFSIKMIEEWYGPLQWSFSQKHKKLASSLPSSDEDSEVEESFIPADEEVGVFSDDDVISNHLNDGNLIVPYSLEAVSAAGGIFNEDNGQIQGRHVDSGGLQSKVLVKQINERSIGESQNASTQRIRKEAILSPILEPIVDGGGQNALGLVEGVREQDNGVSSFSNGPTRNEIEVGCHKDIEQAGHVALVPSMAHVQPIHRAHHKNGVAKELGDISSQSAPHLSLPPIHNNLNPTHSALSHFVSCPALNIDGCVSYSNHNTKIIDPPNLSKCNGYNAGSSGSFGSSNFEIDSDILRCNHIFWKKHEKKRPSKERRVQAIKKLQAV